MAQKLLKSSDIIPYMVFLWCLALLKDNVVYYKMIVQPFSNFKKEGREERRKEGREGRNLQYN